MNINECDNIRRSPYLGMIKELYYAECWIHFKCRDQKEGTEINALPHEYIQQTLGKSGAKINQAQLSQIKLQVSKHQSRVYVLPTGCVQQPSPQLLTARVQQLGANSSHPLTLEREISGPYEGFNTL